MVLKKSELEKEAVKQLMQVLSSASFRKEISHFSGNDYRDMGKITAEV